MPQPRLLVFIPDPTYDQGDESTFEQRSRAKRKQLEARFGLELAGANIGPGFDIPAFVGSLPLAASLGALIFLFFQGKRINENLDGWKAICDKLTPFSKIKRRKPVFQREGAAALALDALTRKLGRSPEYIRLLGYNVGDIRHSEQIEASPILQIDDAPPDIMLGFAIHRFRIEADGRVFKIGVATIDVAVIEETANA